MSLVNGVWHNALIDPPADGVQVLCIKELKNGSRTMCFGTHWNDYQYSNGWITGGRNNNVILWMPLPKIPEKEETT